MSSLPDEFQQKRSLLINVNHNDAGPRLGGFIDWLEKQDRTKLILDEIRAKVPASDILKDCNSVKPPKASSPDEIASIGISLMERCREGNSLWHLAHSYGIRPSYSSTKFQDLSDAAFERFIEPTLEIIENRILALEKEEALKEEKKLEKKKNEFVDKTEKGGKIRGYLKSPILWSILGIIVVIILWGVDHYSDRIDTDKIKLCLLHANRHNYRGATPSDHMREILKDEPINIVLNSEEEAPLRFCIKNRNKISIKNVNLIIKFPMEIKVKPMYEDWLEIEPNEFSATREIIKNTKVPVNRFAPLMIKFIKSNKFPITYSIAAENMEYIDGIFYIQLPNQTTP